jgi:Pilus formation protein N terminal region
MSKTFLPALLLSLGCLLVLPQQQAIAGQILTVEVDESQLMTLPSIPGAIIVGNPAIADVTVQGTKLILHGRGFGQTTLTILDLDGNQIANFQVIGKHTQVSNVAVFRGADRYSYSCAPYCESEIQVGDKLDYTSGLIVQSTAKLELSTGSKTAEAEAPQAPQ